MPRPRRFLTWDAAMVFATVLARAGRTRAGRPTVHRVVLPRGPVWEVTWTPKP